MMIFLKNPEKQNSVQINLHLVRLMRNVHTILPHLSNPDNGFGQKSKKHLLSLAVLKSYCQALPTYF